MHEQAILDRLLSRLDTSGCTVKAVSLVCTPDALAKRLQRDIATGSRDAGILERSLPRLPAYQPLRTLKLDVSALTPEETARRLAAL